MGAGFAPGRLGEAGPPSSVSLAKEARRPRAVQVYVAGDIEVNMAKVPRRTRDGRPVCHTVATLTPGFGGGRLHCSHAPYYRRYVGANFEGMDQVVC